jgi:hypothetical protein
MRMVKMSCLDDFDTHKVCAEVLQEVCGGASANGTMAALVESLGSELASAAAGVLGAFNLAAGFGTLSFEFVVPGGSGSNVTINQSGGFGAPR